MKKHILLASLCTFASIHTMHGMQRLASIAKALRPYQFQRITPIVARRLYTHTFTKPQWPDYDRERAYLIADTTIRNNHLSKADAYDHQALKPKIEVAASQVCPEHHPSKCRTCWSPQSKAFWLVSAQLSQRN